MTETPGETPSCDAESPATFSSGASYDCADPLPPGCRVALFGGIFDKPASYRHTHSVSPETILAEGLIRRGVAVTTLGHGEWRRCSRFDLVHVHHFGRATVEAWLTDRKSTRFVFTSHDGFLMTNYARPWKNKLTRGALLRAADALVALSSREADVMAERFGVDPEKIAVIPNGVSEKFARKEQARERFPFLLYVGQLRDFKGLEFLIRALPAIRTADPRVRLVVVYQTDSLLTFYRRLAVECGVGDYVDFAGAKSPDELSLLYSAAVCVVVPSLVECLSSVVMEAMACGAPVVATDVGAIRDQLGAHAGLIVKPGDPTALAEAVNGLLRDEGLRRSIGEHAKRKVSIDFTVRLMIERHIRLYGRVLAREGVRIPLRDTPLRACFSLARMFGGL